MTSIQNQACTCEEIDYEISWKDITASDIVALPKLSKLETYKQCCNKGKCTITQFLRLCQEDPDCIIDMYRNSKSQDKCLPDIDIDSGQNFESSEKLNGMTGKRKYHYLMTDDSTSFNMVDSQMQHDPMKINVTVIKNGDAKISNSNTNSNKSSVNSSNIYSNNSNKSSLNKEPKEVEPFKEKYQSLDSEEKSEDATMKSLGSSITKDYRYVPKPILRKAMIKGSSKRKDSSLDSQNSVLVSRSVLNKANYNQSTDFAQKADQNDTETKFVEMKVEDESAKSVLWIEPDRVSNKHEWHSNTMISKYDSSHVLSHLNMIMKKQNLTPHSEQLLNLNYMENDHRKRWYSLFPCFNCFKRKEDKDQTNNSRVHVIHRQDDSISSFSASQNAFKLYGKNTKSTS